MLQVGVDLDLVQEPLAAQDRREFWRREVPNAKLALRSYLAQQVTNLGE